MADIYETQVRVSFQVPQGEVNRIKNLVANALSPSFLGRLKGAGGIMGGMLGKAGMALGVAGALVVSSPMLQNTLQQLIKTVMLLIRPIGDIISVGLRPIIDILRPVGLFFRILIKPYISKAMEAMRLGRGFLAIGEYGKAAETYALGVMFLLKPIFDMMVTVATISLEGILAGFKMLGVAILSALGLRGAAEQFSGAMDVMIQTVGVTGARIIVETSLKMEEWLTVLKTEYANMEKTTNISMKAMTGFVGEGFIEIIRIATNYFAPELKSTTNKMFDDIIIYAEEKVAELNKLLGKRPEIIHYPTHTAFTVFGPGGTTTTTPTTTSPTGTTTTININNPSIGYADLDEFVRYIMKETRYV